MPRGGYRPGAGRKPDPEKKRARDAAAAAKAAKKASRAAAREPHGYTDAKGDKTPDAPKGWPFGRDPAAPTAPPAEPQVVEKKSFKTPMEYWEHVLEDPGASASAKHAAAFALAPYVHAKVAPAAKKDEAKGRASRAATGKFAPPRGPRLAVNNA